MRYLRIHTLGFAALLVALTVIHCAPTEAQADRRRRPWTTYGSDRGRLVVACDMRSDTCSDGRKITTQRATPVPCETSPGVWEMVGVDEGCYSVRGLESWAQNTSYLSWGAELDRSPWVGAAVPASQGYQITGPLSQSMAAVEVAEQRTTAWILRADTPRLVTIGVQPTGGCEVEVGTEWRTYSCTEQVAIGVSPEARITQPVGQSVYGIAAWHTRSATPGRPCWGGEAPVTCAADRHTISTEGWPTEAGEISFVYRPGTILAATRFLVDASTFNQVGWEIYISSTGRLTFHTHYAGSSQIRQSDAIDWSDLRPRLIRVQWTEGLVRFWVDGMALGSVERTQALGTPLPPTATIGRRVGGAGPMDGTISSLRVRRFE